MLEKIKNYLNLFYLKRDEAIYTCLKNDIPLTDNNVKEVKEILEQSNKKTNKNKPKKDYFLP